MGHNKTIGQLLEELGFITKEQIEIALDVQRVSPQFFGEILQNLDFVNSGEIAHAIAIQNNLELVDLSTMVPSAQALKIIPYNIAKAKNILPISIDANTLVVATQDVNDLATYDYLRKVSKRDVKFVVEDKKTISRYAEIFYYQLSNPIEIEIESIIQEAKTKDVDIPHLIDLILNNAIKDHATDIHISAENLFSNVSFRIDGILQHYYALPLVMHHHIAARIKILGNLDISEQRKPQDGSFKYQFFNENFDIRISSLPTNYGENIVMRLLGKDAALFNLKQLGFTTQNIAKLEKYFSKPHGIVLIVGGTGSGKTTTLYAALRKINSLTKNVLTIEDPIEYKFSFIKQTQLNEKAGYTFQNAIRAFMRQDPDVMLIGEIRDKETAELAVRASITGHLVLSTLHTNDAVGAIPRLLDLQIASYQISSGVLAVIAQNLVRKLCEKCKRPKETTREELQKRGVSKRILDQFQTYRIYEPMGCIHCRGTGYSRREAVTEIFDIDEDIKDMIAKGSSIQEIYNLSREKGMFSIREDGELKVLSGKTTFEELDRVLN